MSWLAGDVKPPVRAGFLIAVLAGCGPAVDPVAKSAIDRRVALLGRSPLHVAPPTVSQPRPFAVGQWTQHKLFGVRGRPSFLTTKIVSTEADAFWFESVLESDFGKLVTKTLVFVGDRRDPSSIEIRKGRVRDLQGHVRELGPEQLAMERKLFRLVVSWEGQPQEDAVVTAGAFHYCFKGRNVWGPWGAASVAWSHPSVPISGLVRAEGIQNHQTIYEELIGFGDSGAASELP